ncbi:peptidase M23-like protein [Roseimicrobium gellanilyticum]|uniref:Peptidase M23-like protein n=1 Tax=Roseimicrobium gellanilyticum TaxID=748857 RepID=A0A366HSW5_9BACT|nr:M23 family metallopeptidase [Roseimicrobium gellanilyticum]RBP47371.1 peptidase M23-like protein [Roseimicrobium gellanilyticum]
MKKSIHILSPVLATAAAFLLSANIQGASDEDLGRALLKDKYLGIHLGYRASYHPPAQTQGTDGQANSREGDSRPGYHPGIAYKVSAETPVYSPVAGTVASMDRSGNQVGRLTIKIEGATDEFFIVRHLLGCSLQQGNRVDVGTILGRTGGADATHLQVQARKGEELAAFAFERPDVTGANFDPSLVLLQQLHSSAGPVLDTRAATFAGIKFKEDGAKVIEALSFPDANLRNTALRTFGEFMKPPRKKESLAVPVPGVPGAVIRFNPYTGAFAQLEVSSGTVRTTEGLGVGSRFEDFVARYGEPTIQEYSNDVITYRFATPHHALGIVLRSSASPVTYFMVAYDLKRG